jgi:phenylacetate-CoA ligase
VPASQTFLHSQGIDPSAIQSWSDFQQLPLTTKENYLRQHSRSRPDELQIVPCFEQIFHDSFQADRRTTLAVVCFALGDMGGMFSASCCRHLASKGYPITTITPGNNPTEIFRVLQALALHSTGDPDYFPIGIKHRYTRASLQLSVVE